VQWEIYADTSVRLIQWLLAAACNKSSAFIFSQWEKSEPQDFLLTPKPVNDSATNAFDMVRQSRRYFESLQ
jgi:hypothetical protein